MAKTLRDEENIMNMESDEPTAVKYTPIYVSVKDKRKKSCAIN